MYQTRKTNKSYYYAALWYKKRDKVFYFASFQIVYIGLLDIKIVRHTSLYTIYFTQISDLF